MGASKSDHFSEEHNELATLFKAISHPARIAIIEYLLTVDACIPYAPISVPLTINIVEE